MKLRSFPFLLLLLCLLASPARAELAVIVHPANPLEELTRNQLVDIYMGRLHSFPGGNPAMPLDQGTESQARAFYYQALVGRSISQVNAYWARLLFTGRATPPKVLADSRAVLKAVRENRGAIGYVDARELDDTVKVVFRLE